MKKFLESVPKRDLIFISVIFVLLIVVLLLHSSVEIRVNFDEEMLYVTSPRLNLDIPHADVASVELTALPEFGVCVDGFEHKEYCCGIWKNDTWGEYDLCVLPELEQCVVVTLHSGRKMVFTATTDEKTTALYESYRDYLSGK